MTLTQWAAYCHLASANAGWWKPGDQENPNVIATKFALIHSEISEAFEAFRKDMKDDHLPDRLGVEVELADALIRIFELAGALNLDLAGAVAEKMDYNAHRADHTAAARAGKHGKKF